MALCLVSKRASTRRPPASGITAQAIRRGFNWPIEWSMYVCRALTGIPFLVNATIKTYPGLGEAIPPEVDHDHPTLDRHRASNPKPQRDVHHNDACSIRMPMTSRTLPGNTDDAIILPCGRCRRNIRGEEKTPQIRPSVAKGCHREN